jgi:hypothetical protein
MRYWFVYETAWGHRRILAKTIKTPDQMHEEMKKFPGAAYKEVTKSTYEYMAVGDAW